jgi:hypothetical protein
LPGAAFFSTVFLHHLQMPLARFLRHARHELLDQGLPFFGSARVRDALLQFTHPVPVALAHAPAHAHALHALPRSRSGAGAHGAARPGAGTHAAVRRRTILRRARLPGLTACQHSHDQNEHGFHRRLRQVTGV